MEEGRSFTVWPSYFEAIKELDGERRLAIYDAMFAYGSFGVEPKFDDFVCRAVFSAIRPNIDRSIKAHETGKQGGRGNKKKAPCKDP